MVRLPSDPIVAPAGTRSSPRTRAWNPRRHLALHATEPDQFPPRREGNPPARIDEPLPDQRKANGGADAVDFDGEPAADLQGEHVSCLLKVAVEELHLAHASHRMKQHALTFAVADWLR